VKTLKRISLAGIMALACGCSNPAFQGQKSISGQMKPKTPPSSEKNQSSEEVGKSQDARGKTSDDVGNLPSGPEPHNNGEGGLPQGNEGGGQTPVGGEQKPPAVGKKTFQPSFAQQPVDVVWIVDTSRSMTQEANEVNQNLERFMTGLGRDRDLQVTLIGRSAKPVQLLAPQVPAGVTFRQLPYYIFSFDALEVTAAGFCPKATTSRDDKKVCNIKVDKTQKLYEDENLPSDDIRGVLAPYLRENARKVFVVVTDDDAGIFRASEFEAAANAHIKGPWSFYAFRGKKSQANDNCRVENDGEQYDKLATRTMGQTFSICDADWSKNFDTLKNSISTLTSRAFPLTDLKLKEVKEVRVAGQVIPKEKWTLQGESLTIDPSALSPGAQIEVEYLYQP
jgi:hypothetical protein